MDLIILGSSSMTPTEFRNHPSFFLSLDSYGFLFDVGEGTQRQIRLARIKPSRISAVFLSHWHGDHALGLPGLFQMLAANNYSKVLRVIGPKNTKKKIEQILRIFEFTSPLKIDVTEIDDSKTIDFGQYYVKPIKLIHSCETYGFIVFKKSQIKLNKYKLARYALSIDQIKSLKAGKKVRVNDGFLSYKDVGNIVPEEKLFAYISDTLYFKNLISLLKNVKVLLIEATYAKQDSAKAEEYYHLSMDQALKIAKDSKVKYCILTHFSQRYKEESVLELELEKLKKELDIDFEVNLARDLKRYVFNLN
ncbi:MAG: ribonuclease Z [Candidatus Woesearchaeota archaeon]